MWRLDKQEGGNITSISIRWWDQQDHNQSFLATKVRGPSPSKNALLSQKRPSQTLTDPFSPTHEFSGTGLVSRVFVKVGLA